MPHKSQIVFFDMDHTLIDNDCDVSWKEFLIDEGIADPRERDDIQRYWDLYAEGRLPVSEFISFQLRQFIGRSVEEMRALAQRHFDAIVKSLIYAEGRAEIDCAHAAGIPTVVLTSTNTIIAEPVVRALGITHLLGTELETHEGHFTGRIIEPYCYEHNKVTKAREYCRKLGLSLDHATYFGDSVPDIPMLSSVARAVVVNPGEFLRQLASERGWPIVSWAL